MDSTEEVRSLQEELLDLVIANLKRVFDPEINLNVYDLGLIYNVEVNKEFDCQVIMTLTSPNCPAAEILPMEIEFATRAVNGLNHVKVILLLIHHGTQMQLAMKENIRWEYYE